MPVTSNIVFAPTHINFTKVIQDESDIAAAGQPDVDLPERSHQLPVRGAPARGGPGVRTALHSPLCRLPRLWRPCSWPHPRQHGTGKQRQTFRVPLIVLQILLLLLLPGHLIFLSAICFLDSLGSPTVLFISFYLLAALAQVSDWVALCGSKAVCTGLPPRGTW